MNFYTHDAIRDLHPNVVTIRDVTAYDANENIVNYDAKAVEARAIEIEQEKQNEAKAREAAKKSALAKLMAIGLTADEIDALGVKL